MKFYIFSIILCWFLFPVIASANPLIGEWQSLGWLCQEETSSFTTCSTEDDLLNCQDEKGKNSPLFFLLKLNEPKITLRFYPDNTYTIEVFLRNWFRKFFFDEDIERPYSISQQEDTQLLTIHIGPLQDTTAIEKPFSIIAIEEYSFLIIKQFGLGNLGKGYLAEEGKTTEDYCNENESLSQIFIKK